MHTVQALEQEAAATAETIAALLLSMQEQHHAGAEGGLHPSLGPESAAALAELIPTAGSCLAVATGAHAVCRISVS
jgi:hypothetical protein